MTANIILGEWMPPDWKITLGTPVVVETPEARFELASFDDAVFLRDCIVTRSKSVDREKRAGR